MTDTAPGWYPDPDDTRFHRWWDGSAWTDHTNRPQEPISPPAVVSGDPDIARDPVDVPDPAIDKA